MLPKSGDLEFNIFRYLPQSNAGGTKSLQYAELIPKSKFAKGYLRSVRQSNLTRFLSMKIPEVGPAN